MHRAADQVVILCQRPSTFENGLSDLDLQSTNIILVQEHVNNILQEQQFFTLLIKIA
jgi:hypothetical protein